MAIQFKSRGFSGKRGKGKSKKTGIGVAIFLTIWGGGFFAAGLFMFLGMWNNFTADVEASTWTKTPCAIVESEVEVLEEGDRDEPFRFKVRYRYRFDGREFTSTRVKAGDGEDRTGDYLKAYRKTLRYPAGSQHDCYANPEDPDQVVLMKGAVGSGFSLLFPLPFILIGGAAIFFSWRSYIRGRKKAKEPEPEGPESLTAGVAAAGKYKWIARFILPGFFGIFLVVGLAILFPFFINPMMEITSAKGWKETPCKIIWSRVQSHTGDDSTTYSVDIFYSYRFKGNDYKSNRHHFGGGSSSGRAAKAKIVKRHPKGSEKTCFVNPDKPYEAVIHRGYYGDLWFGLIPGLFVLVGLGGIIGTVVAGKKNRKPGGLSAVTGVPEDPVSLAPRTLRPSGSRIGKLVGGIAVAAFWNGIVSIFVFQAVEGWKKGHPDWFLTLFMVPFVLIGLAMIGFIFYAFLGLFNPRPVLTLNPGNLKLGETFQLDWTMSGGAHKVKKMTISLIGEEKVTFQRGTNTATETNTFLSIPLLDTTNPNDMRMGSFRAAFPDNTMPTFKADHNEILWKIQTKGNIPFWPDFKDSYQVVVSPVGRG